MHTWHDWNVQNQVITSLLKSLDSQVTLEIFMTSINICKGSEYSLAVIEGVDSFS
jgi:hypothetical protein